MAEFICRVFHWDIPTVTGLVPLQNLKKRDKVYLFIKFFKSKWLSKKLNYIKIRLFKITDKVIKVSYRLDLPPKIKIHPVYHIAILELVYRNHKPLIYKQETYRG